MHLLEEAQGNFQPCKDLVDGSNIPFLILVSPAERELVFRRLIDRADTLIPLRPSETDFLGLGILLVAASILLVPILVVSVAYGKVPFEIFLAVTFPAEVGWLIVVARFLAEVLVVGRFSWAVELVLIGLVAGVLQAMIRYQRAK